VKEIVEAGPPTRPVLRSRGDKADGNERRQVWPHNPENCRVNVEVPNDEESPVEKYQKDCQGDEEHLEAVDEGVETDETGACLWRLSVTRNIGLNYAI